MESMLKIEIINLLLKKIENNMDKICIRKKYWCICGMLDSLQEDGLVRYKKTIKSFVSEMQTYAYSKGILAPKNKYWWNVESEEPNAQDWFPPRIEFLKEWKNNLITL